MAKDPEYENIKIANVPTPTTLIKAIQNGIEDAVNQNAEPDSRTFSIYVMLHVKDYLSQNFGNAMMNEWTVVKLWKHLKEKLK